MPISSGSEERYSRARFERAYRKAIAEPPLSWRKGASYLGMALSPVHSDQLVDSVIAHCSRQIPKNAHLKSSAAALTGGSSELVEIDGLLLPRLCNHLDQVKFSSRLSPEAWIEDYENVPAASEPASEPAPEPARPDTR